jgi:hypothetical protein
MHKGKKLIAFWSVVDMKRKSRRAATVCWAMIARLLTGVRHAFRVLTGQINYNPHWTQQWCDTGSNAYIMINEAIAKYTAMKEGKL